MDDEDDVDSLDDRLFYLVHATSLPWTNLRIWNATNIEYPDLNPV